MAIRRLSLHCWVGTWSTGRFILSGAHIGSFGSENYTRLGEITEKGLFSPMVFLPTAERGYSSLGTGDPAMVGRRRYRRALPFGIIFYADPLGFHPFS
ncbi:MAG: hypothetical protein R3D29_00895 [Nitratireductor sp.]